MGPLCGIVVLLKCDKVAFSGGKQVVYAACFLVDGS
jgi:hypothetical protein